MTQWKEALVDLGGRNNLLHYRDLKLGTLDLTEAAPGGVEALLAGKPVGLTALYRGERSTDALRRIRAIHNKSKENFEERGLETLALGAGLATWENKRSSWTPTAPVLLRPVSLRALGAAQDEFELALVDEMEVNPTLLHVLKADFDCEFETENLLARVDGTIDEPWELHETYAWLANQARRVPGFTVEPRLVLANFAYAKLPMVRDLEQSLDELLAHPLIGALAGDEECRELLRQTGPGPDAAPTLDDRPLADEFLVLDADSSQIHAINSVIAGQNLVVKGPPGTGKSQSIANLIASLVARGKHVLFVAEKRAAIEAVTKRLNQQGLGDLVLDLHGGIGSRRAFAQSVGRALEASRAAQAINNEAELADLERRRSALNVYADALNRRRDPWRLSVYEARAQVLAVRHTESQVRLRADSIEMLGESEAHALQEQLADYARLGGLALASRGSPWAKSPIGSAEEVQIAWGLLDEVRRRLLPTAVRLLDKGSADTALASPRSVVDAVARVRLWTQVSATLASFSPSVYQLDLDQECAALAAASRGGWSRLRAVMTSTAYRAARQRVRAVQIGGNAPTEADVYTSLTQARDSLSHWHALGGQGTPSTPADLAETREAVEQLSERLGHLETLAGGTDLASTPFDELRPMVDALAGDHGTLARLPQLRQIEINLANADLSDLLTELKSRHAEEDYAVSSFRYVWLQSILEHVALSDPTLAAFVPAKHEKTAQEFRIGDRRHIGMTPARIQRICAEAAVRARDQYKDQADLVAHQAALKRRHLPARDFVRRADQVLLALKPCWAMSPLMVSQLLPPKAYFDVVVFDEASQVTPADAVPAILRGRQLVVAGDDKQLPPTSFFESASLDDDEPDPDAGLQSLYAGTQGMESILDAVGALGRWRMLLWHYRSRDERLIAFSNVHLYDRMLTTFAGTGGTQALRHVLVPWAPGADTNSPAPEVNAVVDLVIEHALQRPTESLGIIAMGIKHSNRIEETLRDRLSADPELAAALTGFMDEGREEHFFVKNLERVQGDERDAIILSVGYGKDGRGQLPYRFGPLLLDGGERRLNVAVTRAKRRMTVVSSFSEQDMDPERSAAAGVTLLRQYLQYVRSDGTNLGDRVWERPTLNPFEADVRDTLVREGLKVIAQYGTSGYWIDFAVQHPTQSGRYVLAIECDGASYHSSESARDRDRLRQEQLERLGWHFHRIWSSEWFYDKPASLAKVLDAYREALRRSDETPDLQLREASSEFHDDGTPRRELSLAPRRENRPAVPKGYRIGEYSDSELTRMVRWVQSDGMLRTEDELVDEVLRALGFQRRGKNVVARITQAIRVSRRGG